MTVQEEQSTNEPTMATMTQYMPKSTANGKTFESLISGLSRTIAHAHLEGEQYVTYPDDATPEMRLEITEFFLLPH